MAPTIKMQWNISWYTVVNIEDSKDSTDKQSTMWKLKLHL